MWRELRVWSGPALIGVISVGTLWLGATGQLALYIHPRYVVFAMVMAGIGLTACVLRVALGPGHPDHHHDHDHDREADAPPASRTVRIAGAIALGLSGLLAAGALLLPPTTLSSATAAQRDVTEGAGGGASLDDASAADDAAFAAYTVRDWSSLLAQTDDPAFFDGKRASVTGFLLPDPDGSDDIVYVARFAITCCAVDAQPIGVPVYLPGWSDELAADDWVEVTGEFSANRSTASSAAIALEPSEVTRVDEPADPYLF